MAILPRRPVFFALIALGVVRTAAAGTLTDLASDSPFSVRDQDGEPMAATKESEIEFRGLIATNEGRLFGLYDRNTRRGEWVREHDIGSGFQVSGFDAEHEVVTVVYQGRKLTLPLATSSVAIGSTPNLAPAVVVSANAGANSGEAARPRTPEQIRTLNAVTEQARINREARAAALLAAGGAQPALAPQTTSAAGDAVHITRRTRGNGRTNNTNATGQAGNAATGTDTRTRN